MSTFHVCFLDPAVLKKGIVCRPSMSQYLPTSWSRSNGYSTASTSSLESADSACSSGEGDAFTSSESDDTETDQVAEIREEGEFKLSHSECNTVFT